jgi:hypothetical protein
MRPHRPYWSVVAINAALAGNYVTAFDRERAEALRVDALRNLLPLAEEHDAWVKRADARADLNPVPEPGDPQAE